MSTGAWDPQDHLTRSETHRMALFSQYAVAAATEALHDASYQALTPAQQDATGVVVGSGIGSLSDIYSTSLTYASSHSYRKISPLFVPRLLINLAAAHIAMRHVLRGPNLSPTTACTTGAHALGDAFHHIALGQADVMVAGASEACVHPLAVAGFARARSLSTAFNGAPRQASRPFDAARDGFVIAEGAGVLVLEALEHARARGARVYAELAGYGASCDAGSSMTAPDGDGRGAASAMAKALRGAGVAGAQVDYVNAHATGTRLGDVAENRAVRRVLRRERGTVNVSSTKGAVGHLLGAAGAVEAIFTVLAIKEGVLPPTLNLSRAGGDGEDGEWDCNYVPLTAQKHDVRVALTNSFGFGGTNASLCFKRFEE